MATAVKEKPKATKPETAKPETKAPPKPKPAKAEAPAETTAEPGLPLEKVEGLRIEAKALAGVMKSAAAVVQSVAIIPILANVRLLAEGSTLEIATSDMDTEYRHAIPLKYECALAVTVDAKRLAAIAGSVDPGAVLSMTEKDGRLSVSAGRSRWQLPIIPPNDFPIIPAFEPQTTVDLPGAALAEAIGKVDWSIYDGKAQPHLAGIYFHSVNGRFTLAATTGTSSCAAARTDASMGDDALPAMVPDKYLATLASMAAGDEGTIKLAWDDRKIRATIGDTILTGKTLENSFPPYQRIIPEPDAAPIVFAPESIIAALKRVNIVADERSRCVTIERGDGAVSISASSALVGTAGEDIEADASAGFATGINGQLFAQMIAAIGGDTIEMHQADAKSPMMFRRVVDDGTLAIIMPMRLGMGGGQ